MLMPLCATRGCRKSKENSQKLCLRSKRLSTSPAQRMWAHISIMPSCATNKKTQTKRSRCWKSVCWLTRNTSHHAYIWQRSSLTKEKTRKQASTSSMPWNSILIQCQPISVLARSYMLWLRVWRQVFLTMKKSSIKILITTRHTANLVSCISSRTT